VHVWFGHWPGCFYEETGGFSLSKIQMFPHKSTLASDQTQHALHDPTVPNENLGGFFSDANMSLPMNSLTKDV
jgi:hypothetical protein